MFENPNHNAILLLVIACIVVILLLITACIGAYRLFLGATVRGLGVIVYFALWICFFPVMLIISLVVGGIWLVVYTCASWGGSWDDYWRDFWA